jgi:hypothetical protein
MSEKPYNSWEEVKKDIEKWRKANICCLAIGLLLIIIGVISDIIDVDFIIVPTSYFLIALFFGVISIAPHIHVVALKSWYGVETERKNK